MEATSDRVDAADPAGIGGEPPLDDAPELSARALGFGLVCGGLLAAANVYAALVVGIVDPGSMVVVLAGAAVMVPLGRAVARPFSRREANVAQVAGTSASTMGLTAGLIGPIPALAMSGGEPSLVAVALWGSSLAVLGSVIALPFRPSFIERRRLAFPTGRATGELIARLIGDGAAGGRSAAALLLVAAGAAATVTCARDVGHLVGEAWSPSVAIAGIPAAALTIGFGLRPLILGVGMLVGLRVALSILAGGALAWAFAAPRLVAGGLVAEAGYGPLNAWLLWPGAALMVVSSLASLALGGGGLVRGWRAAAGARRVDRRVALALAASAAVVVVVGWRAFGVGPGYGALAILAAAVLAVVGMHATGETDQAPAGPLGGLAQIAIGAVGPGGVATPLIAGGVVNGAIAHSATMMYGWRAGRVVGSSPGRLLIAQLGGIAVGAASAVGAYAVLAHVRGDAPVTSPAVLSWKATADMVAGGVAAMPTGAPLAAIVAAIVALALVGLERAPRIGRLVPSPIALGIGFVLPFYLAVGAAAGAAIAALIARRSPGAVTSGVPALASGLIAGEGVAGVAIAALIVAGLL